MNKQKITALTVELILRYYDNDVAPFLAHMDDNALWYGPAERQVLCGKAAMVAAWEAEDNPLTFTVDNIKTTAVSAGSSFCIVAVTFSVVTHYPNGNSLALDQRVVMTWRERTSAAGQGKRVKIPRILCCDITNPHPQSAEDVIYPVHSEQVFSNFIVDTSKGEHLYFHGMGSTEYYLRSSAVMWGDSCGKGMRCLLHLTDGSTVEVAASVRDIVEAHPSIFLRCHASHFVNPGYVKGIRRFTVTMMGDAELPIPEKSYTAFKRALKEFV